MYNDQIEKDADMNPQKLMKKKKKKHLLEVQIPESNIFISSDKKPINLHLN